MNTWSRRSVLGAIGSSAAVGASSWSKRVIAETQSAKSPVVATASGKVRGVVGDHVYVYRGIPYAASTGGKGRFMPPAPPPSWTGVRQLIDCGPPCPQHSPWTPPWVDPRPSSEDCLYLNVWTPREARGRKLPVMVWFHGGGYATGSGGQPVLDSATLAHHGDVVVVTVNHRLNAFGYMYTGGLDERYAESGNLGQRDLIAALEWVRDNIEGFGGNPGNVTIFGESGGGGKVTTLFSMPRADGLYHKGIIQSGSGWKLQSRHDAEVSCTAMLKQLGLGPRDLQQLLAVPPDRLVAAVVSLGQMPKGGAAFSPMLDERSLATQYWEPSAPQAVRNVPMLIGTTHDEASLFLDGKKLLREAASDDELVSLYLQGNLSPSRESITQAQVHAIIDGYRKLTPEASRLELLVSISTDTMMWRNAVAQSERHSAQNGAPVFMYRFDWLAPCFGGRWAAHSSDVPFVFGNMNLRQLIDLQDTPEVRAKADPQGRRYELSRTMVRAWSAFARNGNPSTRGVSNWPAYEATRRATMRLDATCTVEDDPRGGQRKVLDSVLGQA